MPEREEGRESHSRHGHSRPAREPSPKRSRRDGRPEIERKAFSTHNSENVNNADRERRHRRHSPDAVPIETKIASQLKTRSEVEKPSDGKNDGVLDGTKHSSDPAEIPRSRLYFQHDERGGAGQSGRSYARRHTERGRLSDFKDGMTGRAEDNVASHDMQKKEERKQTRPAEDGSWHHDGFFELEAEAPPSRKRPFTEKKLLPDEGNDADVKKDEPSSHNMHGTEKRHERWVDKRERLGNRPARRVESQRREFASRDRFGSRSRFPGGDGFSHRNNETNQNRRTTDHVEKWKHDLFDEANRSPPPKNEEDQIAKVEALLAL